MDNKFDQLIDEYITKEFEKCFVTYPESWGRRYITETDTKKQIGILYIDKQTIEINIEFIVGVMGMFNLDRYQIRSYFFSWIKKHWDIDISMLISVITEGR